MKYLFLLLLFVCSFASAKELLTPDQVKYIGSYTLDDDGAGYSRGFAVRHVNGDTRLLMHTWMTQNSGPITEWSLSQVPLNGTITSANRSNRWSIGTSKLFTRNDSHDSLWWDHAGNRLWYLQSVDYPYNQDAYHSNIQVCEAVDGRGSLGDVYKITLEGVRDRKVHGGAVDVPSSLQSKYGWPAYAVGFGGYASMMTANGGSSMGLAAYVMPDPEIYRSAAPATKVSPSTPGAIIPKTEFKILSERGYSDRGVRRYYGYSFTPNGSLQNERPAGTFAAVNGNPVKGPINYYDGGDYRGANPSYSPLAEPLPGVHPYFNYNGRIQYATQNWVANSDVCAWNWGDQYVGGFLSESGLCLVASLGCGRLYYQSSAGYTDEYIAELHVFDPAQLAEVSAGTRSKSAIQPKAIIPLKETADNYRSLYYHKYAAGYDPVTKRLYVQANRGDVPPYARPFKVYVYEISEPIITDPKDTEIAELKGQVDALLIEKEALIAERDSLLAEKGILLSERDTLLAEKESLITERDALLVIKAELTADSAMLDEIRGILRKLLE